MSSDKIERLRRIPLFSSLAEPALQMIAGVTAEFEVPKGSVLIERGHAGTGLFIIEEGSARVDLPDGEHVVLGEGDFFGEVAVMADTPRTARVAASSDLRGLAIRRDDLMSLLSSNGSIPVVMLREVAQRLGTVLQHLT